MFEIPLKNAMTESDAQERQSYDPSEQAELGWYN